MIIRGCSPVTSKFVAERRIQGVGRDWELDVIRGQNLCTGFCHFCAWHCSPEVDFYNCTSNSIRTWILLCFHCLYWNLAQLYDLKELKAKESLRREWRMWPFLEGKFIAIKWPQLMEWLGFCHQAQVSWWNDSDSVSRRRSGRRGPSNKGWLQGY